MDIFAPRGSRYSERTNEIKAQVAAKLGLAEDATVMVTELTCSEEGCPPIETVIAVLMCEKQSTSSSEKTHGNCCS